MGSKSKANGAGEGLSLMQLVWIAVGQVIGAGVVTIIGSALAASGRSAWIAYAVAVVLGFTKVAPIMFYSSIMKIHGGNYGIVTRALGDRMGGLLTIASLAQWTVRGTAVLSLGVYVNSIFPQIDSRIAAAVIWTILCVVNLFGVNAMAKIQSFATPLLLFALMLFAVVGATQIPEGTLSFSNPDFLTNGGAGFASAIVLLVYSCSGHNMVVNYSEEAKNPTRDIPKAMLISTLVILVIYTAVGFAASNVLPLEEIAGQPLTGTAKAIFPNAVFIFFIIGGPIMALLTTCNSGISANAKPVAVATQEGWLPSIFGKKNKYGVPWFDYVCIWLIAMFPLALNMSIAQITNFVLVIQSLQNLMIVAAAFVMPKKFEKEWKASWMHVPNGVFYALMTVSALFELFIVYDSLKNLTPMLVVINLITLALAIGFGIYKIRTGKIVRIEDQEKAAAQTAKTAQ